MRLKDLPDVKGWTTPHSVSVTTEAVRSVTRCVIDVLQDLSRLENKNSWFEVYDDIYALLDTMVLYTYDPESKRLITVPFPREKLDRLGNTSASNINFENSIVIPESHESDIIDEANYDFNAMRMNSVTKSPMRLLDMLYIIHRGNIEVLLWHVLVNRLMKKGILDVTTEPDPCDLIMLGMIGKSIQTISKNNFPISKHNVPGRSKFLVTMELEQCAHVGDYTQLETALFDMMNNPLPEETIWFPYLEVCSTMYRLIPKE